MDDMLGSQPLAADVEVLFWAPAMAVELVLALQWFTCYTTAVHKRLCFETCSLHFHVDMPCRPEGPLSLVMFRERLTMDN